MKTRNVLLSGATGLLGGHVLARILDADPDLHVYVLVRDRHRWESAVHASMRAADRVTVLRGDLSVPGAGLDRDARRTIRKANAAVLHLGADNELSRGLASARATNVDGTRHLLDLAAESGAPFCLVSSAFSAGWRTGSIPEIDRGGPATGWVNAWEQSRWEAEQIVRESGLNHVILRPSVVVCDDATGRVSRYHAFHDALRLIHAGLVPLLPGRPESPIDVVTADYAASAIAILAFHPGATGATLHLCAGSGAATLGEIVEWSWEVWSSDPAWRRRSIVPPAFTDLSTWRLFEAAVEEADDARLSHITRSLMNLAPRLALETRFDTSRAEALLRRAAPPVSSFWRGVAAALIESHRVPGLDSAA